MYEKNKENGGGRGSERRLQRIFDLVPEKYDLLNRLFTVTLDEYWRRRAARSCLEGGPLRVLDLCCGTGDLALQLASLSKGSVEIVGLDFSAAMLEVAGKKAAISGRAVRFVEGDAEDMDFPDGYFDSVGIAFSFRNLTWRNALRERALAEVRRLLRPGGTFVIVETSQPSNKALQAGFHAYLKGVVAPVGGWLSGYNAAYRYLSESVRSFYDSREVCSMLESAGFENISVEKLMGGVVAIHVASIPIKR